MVINVAPSIAPPISGVLIKYLDWRALFYVSLPMAGIILLLILFFMENVTKQKETKIDILSIVFSSFGFGGLLLGFNTVQENGLQIGRASCRERIYVEERSRRGMRECGGRVR